MVDLKNPDLTLPCRMELPAWIKTNTGAFIRSTPIARSISTSSPPSEDCLEKAKAGPCNLVILDVFGFWQKTELPTIVARASPWLVAVACDSS